MRTGQTRNSLAPGALAPLGKLRECVSAARNLEHLLASREVGPKALEQLVLEVAAELSPWNASMGELCSLLRSEFQLPASALTALETDARSRTSEFLLVLGESSGAAMHAKLRLHVERKLHALLPILAQTLAQLELLAQASCTASLPTTVLDLMTNAPELGSQRPYRPLLLSGPVHSVWVDLPPGVALSCLGMLASLLPTSGDSRAPLHLLVTAVESGVKLTFQSGSHPGSVQVKLPVFPPAAHALESVTIVLGRYGATLLAPPVSLIVPAADQTSTSLTKSQSG